MPTLDLGRVIPLERGAWTSGTSYEFMDSVQYEGSTYVSIFSGTHTAADANRPTTTLGQSTYWRRNARGFEPKGTFNTSTAYERDNLVEWGGSIYRCTANTTAGIAPSNGNYWTSFALGIGEYLGEWNSSDTYAEGAVVIWDVNNGNNINGLFRANQATPANTLPSNTTYWDVMAAGFVWLGEWATGTTYRWRSVVSYHGVLYIAGNITGAPSDENPTLLTNWTRISDGFKFVGSLESLGSGDNLYYGDVVTFANGLYQVITATTGNDDPRLSPSKFRTLTKFWDYQGTWSQNDSYYDNQLILYQNSVYRVNQTTSAGDSPDSAAAKFDTIIAAPDNFQDYNTSTKRLQLRRVDSSTNASTAYANGEPVVIVDGSGNATGELRIHDGSTVGGYPIGGVSPTVNSISGDLFNGLSASLTLSLTNATSDINVEFYNGSTLILTLAATVSNGSATVSTTSAVYNVNAGTQISIGIVNSTGIYSSNKVNKPVIAVPTGGSITTSGGYRYHKFASSGTFTTYANFSKTVEYLVVAGGGGGGYDRGGGGGAGGLLQSSTSISGASSHTVTIGGGGGGNQGTNQGYGYNSSFGSIATATGGGFGGNAGNAGGGGGSGGGGGQRNWTVIGNGPAGSKTSGQGNDGGYGQDAGGGGGGAGAAGGNANGQTAGDGGAGTNSYSTWATATSSGVSGYYAGGGGGGRDFRYSSYDAVGGAGGGGQGGNPTGGGGAAGTGNTGGGGGGGGGGVPSYNGGNGGSGIVLIRYSI